MSMKVMRTYKIRKEDVLHATFSLHLLKEREERVKLARDLDRLSFIDKAFLVDKGHRNGPEIHAVTSNGIIYVLNQKKFEMGYSMSLVTILIARPEQVRRYYDALGFVAPDYILTKCYKNELLGYNREQAKKRA